MQTYLIILRLFHIVTGVFWAGAVFYLARFIIPAAKALGPDGGRFMQQLSMTNNMPVVMMIAASLNILSGILLLWHDSEGFSSWWMKTSLGMMFSTGGTAAIIAYIIGLTMNRPAATKMASLAKEIAAGGGKPTPEQIKEVEAARGKLVSGTNLVAIFLAIAVICMAIARYV